MVHSGKDSYDPTYCPDEQCLKDYEDTTKERDALRARVKELEEERWAIATDYPYRLHYLGATKRCKLLEQEIIRLEAIEQAARTFIRDYWIASVNEDNGAEQKRLTTNLRQALEEGGE